MTPHPVRNSLNSGCSPLSFRDSPFGLRDIRAPAGASRGHREEQSEEEFATRFA